MKSKWLALRNEVYIGKLGEIDLMFQEVEQNIKSNLPPFLIYKPFEKWLKSQLNYNESLKPNLKEYALLEKMLGNIKGNLLVTESVTDSVLANYKENFKVNYLRVLNKKQGQLRLEIAAKLIEEKNFPIEIYNEYYLALKNLPEAKFNEAMGKFWGDVWNPAWKAAAAGAAGGAVAGGGIPGALAGMGTGALVGGAYGAGKHLLDKIWQWYKTHSNYSRSKEDVLAKVKELERHSKNVGIEDQRYYQSINDLIHHLSGTYQPKPPTTDEKETIATADELTPEPKPEPDVVGGGVEPPPQKEPESDISFGSDEEPAKPAPAAPAAPAAAPAATETPPEPEVETPYPQFKGFKDMIRKIGGGAGGNFDKLMRNEFRNISDEKAKETILYLGAALNALNISDPALLKKLSENDINNKIASMKTEDGSSPFKDMTELNKVKLVNLAKNYLGTVVTGKVARMRGACRELGIRCEFGGARKAAGTPPAGATSTATPAAAVPPPAAEEVPEPTTQTIAGAEPPPAATEETPVGDVDIDDLSVLERDIMTMPKDDMEALIASMFHISPAKALKLKGTPLHDMAMGKRTYGKGGKNDKNRKLAIASLRKALGKDKVEEDDISEAAREKYHNILKEEKRPAILAERAKCLPIDERVNVYKEALRRRVNA